MKIGDTVRFVPASNRCATAGFNGELNVQVAATVVQIHEDHRWYRVSWELRPGCTGHECFKF